MDLKQKKNPALLKFEKNNKIIKTIILKRDTLTNRFILLKLMRQPATLMQTSWVKTKEPP